MPRPRKLNLARLIFHAYPGFDLLPFSIEQLNTLDDLHRCCEQDGDGLLRFVAHEVSDVTKGCRGNLQKLQCAIDSLERAREDLRLIIVAMQHEMQLRRTK